MSEERTLVANLVPQVSDTDLAKLIESMQSELNMTVTVTTPDMGSATEAPTGATPTATGASVAEQIGEEVGQVIEEASDTIGEAMEDVTDTMEDIDDDIVDTLDFSEDQEESLSKKGFSMVKDSIEVGIGVLRMVFSLLGNFWEKLKQASPVLRDVVGMFKSAMDLILGPIGTAIGMELIPMLETLYEQVYEVVQTMWDAYKKNGIVGMIKVAMENAIPVFLEVAKEAFDLIPDDIPVISAIRDGVVYVMDWVIEHRDVLANILDAFIRVGNFVMRHFAIVVSLISGFITAYFASKVWDSIPFFGGLLSSGTGALVMGAVAGGTTLAGLSYIDSRKSPGYASGGYIPATPGGQFINVAEGGEGEYIVPESQRNSFANQYSTESKNITMNFYGYTQDELIDKIRDVVNEENHLSVLRGGF